MIEDEVNLGEWWQPGLEPDHYTGSLELRDGEPDILILRGEFSPFDSPEENRIVGRSLGHGDVTLERVYRSKKSSRFGSEREVQARYEAWTAHVGILEESDDPIEYDTVGVQFSHLEEWVYRSVYFDVDYDDGSFIVQLSEQPRQPAVIEYDGFEIEFILRGPRRAESLSEVRFSYSVGLQIRTESKRPISDFNEIIRRLQNFFSLALSTPTDVKSVQGFTPSAERTLRNGRQIREPVEIRQFGTFYRPSESDFHSPQALLPFGKFAGEVAEIVRKWLAFYEELEPVLVNYFSTVHASKMYREHRFLSLTQAVESLHRRRFKGRYMPDDEYRSGLYQELVDSIPDYVDRDFRAALSNGFKYANEYSLRKRVRELVEKLPDGISHLFRQSNRFANEVADSRNYLVHLTDEKEKEYERAESIDVLADHLELVLQTLLMRELGIDDEKISESIEEGLWSPYAFRAFR